MKDCGYEGMRLHDLRGTAATILARRVPMKNVGDYLGHRDTQTTSKYYVHLMNEDRVSTENAMGDFLAGAGFASSCSEGCSESTDNTQCNIISIDAFVPKKLAIK